MKIEEHSHDFQLWKAIEQSKEYGYPITGYIITQRENYAEILLLYPESGVPIINPMEHAEHFLVGYLPYYVFPKLKTTKLNKDNRYLNVEVLTMDYKSKTIHVKKYNKQIEQEMEYYINEKKKKSGPYSKEQIQDKRIHPNSEIWASGYEDWIPLNQFKDFELKLLDIPPPTRNEFNRKVIILSLVQSIMWFIILTVLIGLMIMLIIGVFESDYQLKDRYYYDAPDDSKLFGTGSQIREVLINTSLIVSVVVSLIISIIIFRVKKKNKGFIKKNVDQPLPF